MSMEDFEMLRIKTGIKLVQLHVGNIEWTIEEYDLAMETQEKRDRQTFTYTIEEDGQLPFMQYKIHLERRKDFRETKDILKCTLVNDILKFPEGGLFYRIRLEQLRKDGTVYNHSGGGLQEITNDEKCHLYHDISFRFGPYHPGGWYSEKDYKFKIKFEILIKEQVLSQTMHTRKFASDDAFMSRFQSKTLSDFVAALKMFDTTEIKIICKDKKELIAARAVLRARSPVFNAMFETEMSESATLTISMDDLSSAVVAFILEYIETGKISSEAKQNLNDTSFIGDAIYAAEKYQLMDLMQFFDKTLADRVSERNALSLLGLANKFSLMNGKEKIKDYIQEHRDALDYA